MYKYNYTQCKFQTIYRLLGVPTTSLKKVFTRASQCFFNNNLEFKQWRLQSTCVRRRTVGRNESLNLIEIFLIGIIRISKEVVGTTTAIHCYLAT